MKGGVFGIRNVGFVHRGAYDRRIPPGSTATARNGHKAESRDEPDRHRAADSQTPRDSEVCGRWARCLAGDDTRIQGAARRGRRDATTAKGISIAPCVPNLKVIGGTRLCKGQVVALDNRWKDCGTQIPLLIECLAKA